MAAAGAPWQLECEKVEQRCGYLLTSGLWSDCTIMVGSETNQEMIQAHKLVLAMASPVFEAMFYGGLSDRNEPIVPIPDVQPEAFRALLHYIYTGDLNIDSLAMACNLWYGANKYMLPHLVNKCISYICAEVGPSNACRVYELASLFEEKAVIDTCLQIIRTKTREVLNDTSFDDVELKTVITVCSLDHLDVESELDLFHAVESYAEAEQRRKGRISPTKLLPSPAAELDSKTEAVTSEPRPNKGDLKEEEPSIHTALEKIRFLSLSAQEFAEGPARSGLLTKDETLAILMNIASRNCAEPMPSGFSECRERRQPRDDPQEQCFKPGGLDHTIDALKHGSPSQVKEAGHVALEILASADEIQPALDKGILEALVPALTEGDDECKLHAACAIYNLSIRGSPTQLHELAASAVLEPYCQLLTAAGSNNCYCALRGLHHLVQKVKQNTRADLIPRLRALGVPELLAQHGPSYGAYRMVAIDLLQMLSDDQ